MIRNLLLTGLAALGLAACQDTAPVADVARLAEQPLATPPDHAPPGAAPGTCWGKHVTPAVIETVTDHVLQQPARRDAEGAISAPAHYRTETHQRIVTPRQEIWFETPCAAQMTAEFTATLQRALAARGMYHGPVTGTMDPATRRAVRTYQATLGLDSATLSLSTARKLGLIAYPRPGEDG
jgi:hypothetical protein